MRLNTLVVARGRNERALHIHTADAVDAPLRHSGGVGGQACIIYGRSALNLLRCDFDEAGVFVEEPISVSRCAPISVSCCGMKGNF